MTRARRWTAAALAVAGLVVAMTLVGAVGFAPDPEPAAVARPEGRGSGGDIDELQERLRARPSDARGWAALGNLYLESARASADPGYYGMAEGAFERSLEVRGDDNVDATTGQAALAAARHDFAGALSLAERAQEMDDFHPPALAVLADALIELGRYDEGFAAVERLNSISPGFPAYSRASYVWELQGDAARATEAMELALEAAGDTGSETFAAYHLGQLAFGQGDLETADARFAAGLQRDPRSAQLLAGRARVAAARGETEAAIQDYTASLDAVPAPAVLAELGDLYASLGRADEARDQYEVVRATQRLAAAGGQDVDLELSLFDADHGQPAGALAAAEAVYAARRSIFAEDALAWALYRNGRPAEALPHARAALRLGTGDAMLRYHLGMINAAVGDAPGAVRELERALTTNPYFSSLHAPRAQAELDRLRAGQG